MPTAAQEAQAFAAFAAGKRHDRRRQALARSRATNVLRRAVRRRRIRTRGRRGVFVNKQNVEIKTIEHAPVTLSVIKLTGSDVNGPENSMLAISGLHGGFTNTPTSVDQQLPGIQRGTDCSSMIGCFLNEAYGHSFKFTVDFTPAYENISNGRITSPYLEVVHGMLLNTAEKMGVAPNPGDAAATRVASFKVLTDIHAAVKQELFRAGFSSDHLSFSVANRRVKVLKRYKIHPKQSALQVAMDNHTATDTRVEVSPPLIERTYKFPANKRKQRLAQCGTLNQVASQPEMMYPCQSWIPFTLFMSPTIGSTTGGFTPTIHVKYSSKCWLRDS